MAQQEIASAIEKIVRDLAPDVVRIRFELGDDWSGDPAVFFRIVLSDKASNPRRLREITHKVSDQILKELDLYAFGLLPYFSYRSASEQAELKEPAWA